MIKKAVLMLGMWLALSMWQRGRVDPMAAEPEDDGLGPLSPFPQQGRTS